MRIDAIIQYNALHKRRGVILLIDPEKLSEGIDLEKIISSAVHHKVDFFFIGGSLIMEHNVDDVISSIQQYSQNVPIILFPGNIVQLSNKADGILFLSLISGRNSEFLIGQHVVAAPLLSKMDLEVLPTGYMLVNSGEVTSVHYMSQTLPIPNSNVPLCIATAMAGRYLGMKYIYMDAGSGAKKPVDPKVILGVKQNVNLPLIIGGGIDSLDKANAAWEAGADYIVIGNGAEKNLNFLIEVLITANMYNLSLNIN